MNTKERNTYEYICSETTCIPSGSFEANALSYTDPREASFHTWVLLPSIASLFVEWDDRKVPKASFFWGKKAEATISMKFSCTASVSRLWRLEIKLN